MVYLAVNPYPHRFSTESSKNNTCHCQRGESRLIKPFKVSEHLTILLCIRCGNEIARWEDRIKPAKREWLLEEQEAMR
jgi:hypothetical protein